MLQKQEFRVSVAPMMDWTDRYCRVFHRALSRRVLLYTEMVVADAVIHGKRDYLLGFDRDEHPVALQIGGSNPEKLALAAKIGEDFGYDEININIGCPSDRVQAGRFGACLMQEADLVAQCFASMQAAVEIPVTVKCRLGVDEQDVGKTLPHFLETVAKSGCTHFIIHARKAWLHGLSPKENRLIPPLDYDLVRAMKAEFPNLEIVLNGGLETLESASSAARSLDGIMFGRAAYQNPWILSRIDCDIYGESESELTREAVVVKMIEAAREMEGRGLRTRALTRHMNGLYHGTPGARLWRRRLSEGAASGAAASEVIENALSALIAKQAAA